MEEMMLSPLIDYEEYEDLVKNEHEKWLLKQIEKMAGICHTMYQKMLAEEVSYIDVKNIKLSLALIDRLNHKNGKSRFRQVYLNLKCLKFLCEGRLYDSEDETSSEHVFSRIIKECKKHYKFSSDKKVIGVFKCGKETYRNWLIDCKMPSRDHAIRIYSGFNLGYNLIHFGLFSVGYMFRLKEDEKIMKFLKNTTTDNLLTYLEKICNEVYPHQYDVKLLASFYKYK